MGPTASQITILTIIYSIVYSGTDQTKHPSSASLKTSEFPAQKASNAEHVSIWWRHHVAAAGLATDGARSLTAMDDTEPNKGPVTREKCFHLMTSLSGVPDYFGRNKISSGGDLSHYSSASLY